MRIGIIFFFKNIKKQQYPHTKIVARLVDNENLLQKNTIRTQKRVARLVDSKNWSKKNVDKIF